MAGTTFRIGFELEDGTTGTVTADQRDIAEFEVQPFGLAYNVADARPFTFLRFLAWHAGRRQKLHNVPTYEAWKGVCVYAYDADMREDEDEGPGQPEASAGI
jgi:hypothetical protein